MKIRLISGSCYIAILVAFFCLKIFLPYGDFYFDALIYAFTLLGTFEMLRAVKDKTTKVEKILVYAYAAACIPACAISEYVSGAGFTAVAICTLVFALALLSLLVIRYEETSLESLGFSLLSAVYPTVLLSVLVLTNHAASLELWRFGFDSRLLILFVFVVTPCADSIAYVFGRYLKKYFPKKMAPTLSPNKTVIGGIGGLVGGMLGALALYFIYNAIAGSYAQMHVWLPIYLVIGLLSSAVTAFGDLVESCIKRKVGLKDMGNIMPGHGGALDRLDSVLFAAPFIYFAYHVVCWIL
ncbi:MAG: phosphatidate cytidylyltransferase [Clostridia bacterium]|nr:phosphatidate cytidylyltransferase [Clostridia bacterium]